MKRNLNVDLSSSMIYDINSIKKRILNYLNTYSGFITFNFIRLFLPLWYVMDEISEFNFCQKQEQSSKSLNFLKQNKFNNKIQN